MKLLVMLYDGLIFIFTLALFTFILLPWFIYLNARDRIKKKMSHFSVLVIGDDVEGQLAPYQENNMGDCPKEYLKWRDDNGEWHDTKKAAQEASTDKKDVYQENPNAKWDWYQIGGRWSGHFRMKKGKIGLKGEGSLLMKNKAEKGTADQALKKDIDFMAMRKDAHERATNRYNMTLMLFGGEMPPKWQTWDEVRESNKTLDIETKREAYWGQPALKKLKELQAQRSQLELTEAAREHLTWLEMDDYAMPIEEYVKRAVDGASGTFAVIKDGKWYERGEMGWWGAVGNEKDTNDWNAEFAKLLDSVSPETLLTVVDCHI